MTPGDESEEDDKHTFEFHSDDDTSISVSIIRAMGAIEDVDPIATPEELDVTLRDYIDPDALDTIVESSSERNKIKVKLKMDNYCVLVTDTGRIRIQFQ